ncbi:MAG: glutamine--tRNA ligase/YqeY domain fusion protein [Nitrospinota bacterium]|nr:glutamine--tRNA ligase/YqeY domain fusion protein [Nitrospinota bacterium]
MSEVESPSNFIQNKIDEDLKSGKFTIHTRFPPEPNGHLHIGHAKSICLNFGLAEKYSGLCNLRFDDTNPSKEETKYVKAIKEDVKWLGFDWGDRMFYASDYFDQLFEFAMRLIQKSKAYVDDLAPDQIREYRGTLSEPGKNSPFRDRSIEENLDLFQKMKAGEFKEGEKVLRAKIDMGSANLNMRDPILYRILRAPHHRTGDKWCVYPMYDFTHGQSDSIENITHSLCTLEFEDHRPLYDWFLNELEIYHPQQIEFARLNLNYTILSKRKLLQLVEEGHVEDWDDPRMPTLSGMRRRGYPAEAIREFCERIGISKSNSTVDFALLEHCVRENLNLTATRVMAVLRPLKVILVNYPEEKVEKMDAVNNPEDLDAGTRKLPFSRTVYIEREDFMEDPPKKFFRLAPGREVRLKHAYVIKCKEVVKNKEGEIIALHCTYDPETRSGSTQDGRKVKGTLHWVSVSHAQKAEVRLYNHLFTHENPADEKNCPDLKSSLNPNSLEIIKEAFLEPSLKDATGYFQFLRLGYFCADNKNSSLNSQVFNRIVTLRDSWAKIVKK